MHWKIGCASLITALSGRPLIAGADVQRGTYDVTVTQTHSAGTNLDQGPLAGLLPQMNESQQWLLCGIGLLIIGLLGLLIKIWWQSRRQTKEQS